MFRAEVLIPLPTIATKITGLIGHPIGHSLSPLMHNTAFELMRMDYVYLAFDVQSQNLAEALTGLVALGIAGVNVTIPHKESVIPHLDDLSNEAHAIGAVNTIVNDGAKLKGHNTDVYGFVETLKSSKDAIADQEVSVLGSGGAARAILYGLITNFRPRAVHLLNRSVERATALREFFADSFGFQQIDVVDLYMPSANEAISQSKLIVNATPLGMSPKTDDSPIRTNDCFSRGQILLDLVYNPVETKLLRQAKLRGTKTISGIDMLLHQGARSFEFWTNRKFPIESVRRTLRTHLSDQ